MDFEEKLIEEVKNQDAIYNKWNIDYFHLSKKLRMWEDIAKRLGRDSEVCKKRWKTLRDHYNKLKKKKKNRSNWRYLKSLTFLDETPSANLPQNEDANGCHENDDSKITDNCMSIIGSSSNSQSQVISDNTTSDVPSVLAATKPNDSEKTETHIFYEYIAERIIKANLTDTQRGYIDMEVLTVVNASLTKYALENA